MTLEAMQRALANELAIIINGTVQVGRDGDQFLVIDEDGNHPVTFGRNTLRGCVRVWDWQNGFFEDIHSWRDGCTWIEDYGRSYNVALVAAGR